MDAVYLACVVLAGVAIVVMTLVIPYGVVMRYVFNSAAPWPEPLAVLMMIVFSFAGAAACYRANSHIAVSVLTARLSERNAKLAGHAVDVLMAGTCVFTVIWGIGLSRATWGSVVAEFPFLPAGATYLPIPIGGAITLLFIAEKVMYGRPAKDSIVHRDPEEVA
ncbi:MAG: TRAP transporter small permease [Alphaproteobacteria bacterium]|nr:TRAP transporter small permease [Alphaproteobacteria bacterium]